jgi:hypothetical protein
MPTGALVRVWVVDPDAKVDVAVIFVAPSEWMLAASIVTVATPPALVRAVAETGLKATRALEAAKETTAPDTRFPSLLRNVALTVTGVPNETVLDDKVKTRELKSVVSSLSGSVPVPSLLPQPMSIEISTESMRRIKKDKKLFLVDFAILDSFSLGRV